MRMRWTLPLLFVACKVTTPDPDDTSFPSCEAIAVACHNLDLETDGGTARDCHVLGHTSKTEAACAAKKDECLAFCSGDGGADADAGGDQ
jgi:hypothetical protein